MKAPQIYSILSARISLAIRKSNSGSHLLKSLFWVVMVTAFFASCQRKEDTVWDTRWKAPLFRTDVTIQNLIGDSLLQSDSEGRLSLVYEENFLDWLNNQLIDIPDTSIRDFYALPFGSLTVSPGNTILSQVKETEFALAGTELRFCIIKKGTIQLRFRNKLAEKILIEYTLPTAKKNGQTLVFSTLIPEASSAGPGILVEDVQLDGYEIDLTGLIGNKKNTLVTIINAQTNPNGSAIVVTPQDSLQIELNLKDIEPWYARGYFGQRDFSEGPRQQNVGIFDRIRSGTFTLERAKISLELKNYVGADAKLRLKELTSINTRTGQSVALQHSLIGLQQNIGRAADHPHVPTQYSYLIETANSNINSFLENMPNRLQSAFDLNINPFGNISGGHDFVYTDKSIEAALRIEIPLHLSANELTLIDTIRTDSINNPQVNAIKEGTLSLIISNGFPLNGRMNFYFLEGNSLGEKVFPEIILQAGLMNSEGKVETPWQSKIPVYISPDLWNRLRQRGRLVMITSFSTSNLPDRVHLYDHYKLEARLVADAEITIKAR